MRMILKACLALLIVAAPAAHAAEAPLTDIERIVIEHECEKILARYTYYTDSDNLDGVLSLYSQDAVLDNASGPISGYDNIKAYLVARLPKAADRHGVAGDIKRHVLTNVVTDVIDRDHARSVALYTVYYYSPDPKKVSSLSPTQFASLTNTFVRTKDGWRYQHRKVVQFTPEGGKN